MPQVMALPSARRMPELLAQPLQAPLPPCVLVWIPWLDRQVHPAYWRGERRERRKINETRGVWQGSEDQRTSVHAEEDATRHYAQVCPSLEQPLLDHHDRAGTMREDEGGTRRQQVLAEACAALAADDTQAAFVAGGGSGNDMRTRACLQDLLNTRHLSPCAVKLPCLHLVAAEYKSSARRAARGTRMHCKYLVYTALSHSYTSIDSDQHAHCYACLWKSSE